MKRLIEGVTFALLLIWPSALCAQTTTTRAPEEFLSGGWVTDPDNRIAALSAGLPNSLPETAIRVWSAYMVDQADIYHVITTDRGTVTVSTIPESSGALIEGRNIELRQGTTNGKLVGGGWTAVKQPIPPGSFSSFGWNVFPGQSAQILDLAAAKQFVLTFLGHTNPPCNNGRVKVNVDGQWLKYRNGAVLQLPPGASVWSQGKSVFVMWDGSCTLPNPAPTGASAFASGSIKVAY